MVSGTRALLKKVVVEVEGEQGSGPEGVDDLCFHTYGDFLLLLLLLLLPYKDKHDMFLVKLLPKDEGEISNMIMHM